MLHNKLTFISTLVLMLGASLAMAQQAPIQYFRPWDKKGINVFETSKNDTVPFDGFKFRIGAGFTQGWQNLKHSNESRAILTDGSNTYFETSTPNVFISKNDISGSPALISGTFKPNPYAYGTYLWDIDGDANTANSKSLANSNALYQMAAGFPLAQANLNFDVQIADGVRLSLVSYMSSHHHNEFWVKGGYFQIDKVGFLNNEFLNKLWTSLTLKVGHMEINYGDAHYRRSDGGNTLQNPFMENYIMDAFATEIGAELYWQKEGVIVMGGFTDGEIQGNVTKPDDRKPRIYGKLGYDKQFTDDFRFRITGSVAHTKSSISNTLYGGDRTGSNYQYVTEPTTATLTGNAFSGRFNPGFRDNSTTIMINPFVKFKGFEFFGVLESATGNTSQGNGETINPVTGAKGTSVDDRKASQIGIDLLYRFGKSDQFYVGGRYNQVKAEMMYDKITDISIDRTAFAAGWFLTPKVLFKAEYVVQNYNDIPVAYKTATTNESDRLAGAQFKGLVIQGSISF